MRILVVEDDIDLSEMLRISLSQEGCIAEKAGSGEEGEFLAESINYDAIILDLGLPDKDGLDVLQSWRSRGVQTPVLILTARVDDADIIRGLDSGADDYLIKPFNFSVLYARIKAMLRRKISSYTSSLQINTLTLDTVNQQLWRGTNEIKLTPREYAVFEYLARHPNRLISRSILEQSIWNSEISSNVIDAHIKNLRAKLGEEHRNLIQAVRQKGYRLVWQ